VAGGFVGLTMLGLPATGWLGARPGPLSDLLKERILARLGDPQRFAAVPLAMAGGAAVAARPPAETSTRGRRLFLSISGAWVVATVCAVVAQVLGVPTQVARAHRYVGSPADYLAHVPSAPLGDGLPPGETDAPDPELWGSPGGPAPVALVLERYNAPAYRAAATTDPSRVAAPGVLVLRG